MSITVTGLYCYPIKSCRGISLPRGEITPRGFRYDRHWMITTVDGTFLTQREVPRFALIEPQLDLAADLLRLRAPDMPEISLPLAQTGPLLPVTVWKDTCLAVDDGDIVADWLSTFLGSPVRLFHMADTFTRTLDARYAPRPTDHTGFADGYPFLFISEETLADLNTRLATPLPMDRFRPNIVVTGESTPAEDSWMRVQINGVAFDLVKACARCAITTTDQQTAARGKEPLTTLATYRNSERGVLFGQNAVHATTGEIAVGATVEVLLRR